MRILVIEDDAETAGYLNKGLTESGHNVDHATDGKDGLYMAMENDYDVMIIVPNAAGTRRLVDNSDIARS